MMNYSRQHSWWAFVWSACSCSAGDSTDCLASQVDAHVMEQFRIYGPLSRDREYFGFIFQIEGVVDSAVTRGGRCWTTQSCEVRTADAAAKIPHGAKVLGEWHTHPRSSGTAEPSLEDVRGAYANRHIRCYRAFFSTAHGEILSWDVEATQVAEAMTHIVRMGSYRERRTTRHGLASRIP